MVGSSKIRRRIGALVGLSLLGAVFPNLVRGDTQSTQTDADVPWVAESGALFANGTGCGIDSLAAGLAAMGHDMNPRDYENNLTGHWVTYLGISDSGRYRIFDPFCEAKFTEISVDELNANWRGNARTRMQFQQLHIGNSHNLPAGSTVYEFVQWVDRFPKERPMVVLCVGGACSWDEIVANRLISAGFTNVRVFDGGISECFYSERFEKKNGELVLHH